MTTQLRTKVVEAGTLRAGDEVKLDPCSEDSVVIADADVSQFSPVVVWAFIVDGQIADVTLQKTDLVHKVIR